MNFSELVSIDPNQIKARANTNVYLVIGLLIHGYLSSSKIKERESNSSKTSGHSESSSCRCGMASSAALEYLHMEDRHCDNMAE